MTVRLADDALRAIDRHGCAGRRELGDLHPAALGPRRTARCEREARGCYYEHARRGKGKPKLPHVNSPLVDYELKPTLIESWNM